MENEYALLLRVEQACRQLAISRAKLAQLIAAGDVPSIKIGRSRRIPADRLREWVEQRASEALT